MSDEIDYRGLAMVKAQRERDAARRRLAEAEELLRRWRAGGIKDLWLILRDTDAFLSPQQDSKCNP